MIAPTLDAYLEGFSGSGGGRDVQIAEAVRHLAEAAIVLRNETAGNIMVHAKRSGARNAGGDSQYALDLFADRG